MLGINGKTFKPINKETRNHKSEVWEQFNWRHIRIDQRKEGLKAESLLKKYFNDIDFKWWGS